MTKKQEFINNLEENCSVNFSILAGLYYDLDKSHRELTAGNRRLKAIIEEANIYIGKPNEA